jgi:hypothetical protein
MESNTRGRAARLSGVFVSAPPPSLLRVLLAAKRRDAMRVDFELSGGGTVYLLRPVSRAAHNWVENHLPDDATWFGGAVVVEHRYIGPIIGGAIGDGLLVQ